MMLRLLILACAIGFSAPLGAQGFTAALVGLITDPSDALVPGVEIVVANPDTGLAHTLRSGSNGEFALTHLPPGRYRLTARASGFRTFVASDVVLEVDQVRRVDVRFEVGGLHEQVTVSGDAAVVSGDSAAKATVVSDLLVQSLPLNGRNYLDLALLAPGVYRRVGDEDGDGVATNGTRWDATAFALDGIINRADRNGNSAVPVGLDAVREFDVQTSTYSAEYGRNAGAQINVVSKSGTNRYAGSLADFERDDDFDARNPFARPDQPSTLNRRQTAGTLGGPLRRDRTFFFGAVERMDQRQSRAATSTAPNAAWMTGDFRNVRGVGADGISGNADDTNRILDPLTRREFPTPNLVPASMIDPIARQILAFIPAANIPGSLDGYAANGLAVDRREHYLMKIEHQWPASTAMALRWARSLETATDPFPSARVFYPGFSRDTTDRGDSVALSATTRIGTAIVNEVRLGYVYQHVANVGEQAGTNYVGQLGLAGLSQEPALWGFPTIRIDGFAEFGDRPNDPSSYTLRNRQFLDVLTWMPGPHVLKAGVDVIQSNYEERDLRSIRGDFRFRGRGTNTANGTSSGFRAFADFLLGAVDQTQRQIGSEPARLTSRQTALFVQDDWRIRPSLTVTAGLRYERQPPLKEAADRLANFVPSLGTVVLAGDPRFPPSLLNEDGVNLAPRLGFAWRLSGRRDTIVRGGAGVYYSLENFNVARQQLAVSFPFVQREQYSRTNDPSSLTFSNPFPMGRGAIQGINTPLGMAVDYRTPEIYQYNLTVEREIRPDLVIEAGYVGSQGRHLGRRYNLNQPIPSGLLPDGTLATVKPFPAFADIQYQDQTISSSYNALQTSVRRRAANGLSLLISYTLGRSIDEGSNSSGNLSNVSTTGAQKAPQDIYNMRAERGRSDFDRRQQLSAALSYELPIGPGMWTRGWQVSGILTLLSGRPFTPQYSAGDFATQRPDLVSDPMAGVPAGLWFNPGAFARPVATVVEPDLYGNAGRNILTGPGFQTLDVALARTFRMANRARLQVRVEMFNALNHSNYQVPVFLLDSSNVGRVTSTAGDPRQLQLGLRIVF